MEAAQLPRCPARRGHRRHQRQLRHRGRPERRSDALAIEAADGEAAQAYANVLAVKEGRENDPAILALVRLP